MSINLECQKRPESINPRALRRQGLIPAALYGHNGTESVSLTVKAKDAELLLKAASVNNTLVDINIPELPWSGKALIREVQSHPWKKTLYHLSFFSVGTHNKIQVTVPIKLVGEATGVKFGGIVDQIMTEVTVECAPDVIPESIDVDVSDLEIGTNLHLSNLKVPAGVSLSDDTDKTVVAILPPVTNTETEANEEA